MKYIVSTVLTAVFLSNMLLARENTHGRPYEDQREYRRGFADGVTAGQKKGQGVWQVLGCIAGVVGSVGGCYTCALGSACWYDESCIDFSEESVPWIVAVSGCAGGMITGGMLYTVAGDSGDMPVVLVGENLEYTRGYIDGYQHITQRKKRTAVITSTILGTSIGTLWLVFITYPGYWD